MKYSKEKLHKTMWWAIAIGGAGLLYAQYDSYVAVLPDVVGVFFAYAAIHVAYKLSEGLAEDSKEASWWLFLKLMAGCAFIASLGAQGLGSYYQDADPVFGGGHLVIDYIPSDVERQHAFWKVFLILALSAVTGLHKGLETRAWNERIEKLKQKSETHTEQD